MKHLHKFVINIEKEVEKTEVKQENGQEITVKTKVKEQVPHTFILKKPGRGERIRYVAVDRTESWSDPEEKVRARAYAR